jgi:N6-L-threonylcarbamoyladenine synthase
MLPNQLIHNLWRSSSELASRAHQNIVPVIDAALVKQELKEQLSAIAFTQGTGLMGSLLVGSSFAKSMAIALEHSINSG